MSLIVWEGATVIDTTMRASTHLGTSEGMIRFLCYVFWVEKKKGVYKVK